MLDIQNVNLADLVPDNLKEDASVSAAIEAINGELSAVSQLCMVPAVLSRIDELSSSTLDHLAWQFDSKLWRDTWPLNLKRSVIRAVILEKSRKGTLYAVRQALESLGSASVIREWWELDPPVDPHTFSITVTVNNIPGQTNAQSQEDLRRRLDDVKPVRSHYDLSLALNAEASLATYAAARPAAYARLQATEAA